MKTAAAFPDAADVKNAPDIHSAEAALPNETGILQNFKQQLVEEINALGIDGMTVDDLNLLTGAYVNLEYPLSNGTTVKYLNDKDIYLGNQIERQDSERCYGVVADERFILVCEYGCNGADPEIVLYKRR